MTGLTGARAPHWEVWLLNDLDQPLRQLTTVTDGQITLSATDRLGGSATLTIDEDTAASIDWLADRCRIIYDPGVPGVEAWPVATLLFSSPVYHRRLVSSYEVGLQTKLLILDQETTGGSWALRAGENLVEAAARLIRVAGETTVAVTPSPAAASTEIVFPAGESVLTVVNTLLKAANYWAVHTDGAGQYIIAPYQPPSERPIVWEFETGELALHAPEWDRSQDLASVPNRVECYTAGTDTSQPLFGVAEDTTGGITSYQARGRWVTRREQVEAASQHEIDELARRYLISGMSPISKLSATHAMLNLRPRQAVRFRSPGVDTRAVIQKMSMPLRYDAQISAEWNEV